MDLCQQGDARAAAALLMQIRARTRSADQIKAIAPIENQPNVGWLTVRFVLATKKTLQTTFVAHFLVYGECVTALACKSAQMKQSRLILKRE